MVAYRRLHRRGGDLPRAFRNQLASLREEMEAAEAEFQGLDARIKELEAQIKERERLFRSSLGESKVEASSTAPKSSAAKLNRKLIALYTRPACSQRNRIPIRHSIEKSSLTISATPVEVGAGFQPWIPMGGRSSFT